MDPKQVPIAWNELEIAVERNSPSIENFLEMTTGRVVAVVAGDPEAELRRQEVADNIRSFLRIEPASSREQYRWMERFVASVGDDGLRERLIIAIDGKGAFRRFKDVLLAYPAERERWFSYRAELLHWHIHNWLQEHGLAGTSPPPWGAVNEPRELESFVPASTVHAPESPGEALRREARELIDKIPAIDLPSALAFLEFLGDRSSQALLAQESESRAAGATHRDQNRRRVAG